jgi:hypothetical protein
MANIRIHRYAVDPDQLDELITRRATLIAAVRQDHPGLVETRLVRLEDGTFVDTWRWATTGEMDAAAATAWSRPEAGAAMSLTRDATADDGEIVDER